MRSSQPPVRPALRVGPQPGSCARRALVAAALTLLACGGGDAAGPRRVRSVAPVAPRVPAPPPADVPGASAMPPEPEVPSQIEPLAARLTPRSLPIPRTRRGRSVSFRFDGDHRGWFARLPEGSRMHLLTPVYGAGKVYVGGGFSSNSFYALDAKSGRLDWVASAPDGGPTAAIVEDDKVLFNTESCTLFVVDAKTGRLRWKRWLGDPIMGQAAANDGRVFSGHVRDGGGHGFTAMRLRNGRVLWTRRISADVMNAPVLDDTDVYFTTMDGVLWSFEQATGRLRWHRRVHASSAPWLDGTSVHVTRRKRVRDPETHLRVRVEQAMVLAKSDGATLRTFDDVAAPFVRAHPESSGTEGGWAYEGSRPTVVDGRTYQTIGDEVHARDADTGELLWRRRYTERARTRPASPPAVAGSQLVFGTRDGVLYGLDIDTGMTTWAYDVGEPITSQPTVAAGWVYASTARGGVIGIQVADASVGGWHMWGGNARHNGVSEEPEPAEAPEERPGEGVMGLEGAPRPGELAGFPLSSTEVHAQVTGFVARVEVTQVFTNPYDRPVEATYLFPLPDDSAVDAMELRTGERVIHASIRRREQARREYRAARRRGALASLLEQDRPNLFRQSVANIAPGHEVRVVLRYSQVLPYEEGSYRFIYPMLAGPRYTPAPAGAAHPHPDQRHPDQAGSEGSEPVSAAPRHDLVKVSLDVRMAGALRGVTSPTHAITVTRRSEHAASVRLSAEGVAPDRDLDLRFAVAGDEPEVSLLSSPPHGAARGYLTLLVHPKLAVADDEVARRELVFLVDTSSSMRGRPIELAKAAMRRALDGLRPGDTFRIVRFSDGASELSAAPLEADAANIRRGKAFVDSMRALGATEMKRGIRAALDPAPDPERMRVVLLMTDGYIGNESEVFREVHGRLGQSRLFAFGVGGAVNRYLLSRLTEIGRGDLQVVTLSESPEAAADRFHARIARPFLTDVQVDWGGLEVDGVYPRRVPDLYADRPLVVFGRFAAAQRGTVTVRGRIAGRRFAQSIEVSLPGEGEARPQIESLWARTRIRDLMTAMSLRPNDALREEVIQLGLAHHLLTQWTAFVAVDEESLVRGEGPAAHVEPAPVAPAGMGHALRSASGVGMIYGAVGSGGMALSGVGRGGGGTGYGTIGVGSIGTVGSGGSGSMALARRVASVPVIRTGRAAVRGALARPVLRATIQRQRARFRACYEDALRRHSGLRGRVVLHLTVLEDGSVSEAVALDQGLGDGDVITCIAEVGRTLVFPAVSGAGVVEIAYPFVFAPSEPPDGLHPPPDPPAGLHPPPAPPGGLHPPPP